MREFKKGGESRCEVEGRLNVKIGVGWSQRGVIKLGLSSPLRPAGDFQQGHSYWKIRSQSPKKCGKCHDVGLELVDGATWGRIDPSRIGHFTLERKKQRILTNYKGGGKQVSDKLHRLWQSVNWRRIWGKGNFGIENREHKKERATAPWSNNGDWGQGEEGEFCSKTPCMGGESRSRVEPSWTAKGKVVKLVSNLESQRGGENEGTVVKRK